MADASIPDWLRHFLRLGPAPALSDAALLQHFIAAGDEEAFGVLLRRHGPLVWGVCRRILTNLHDAEDAFQATFLLLARRAGAIRRSGSLASFLHGVARRLAVRLKQRVVVLAAPVDLAVADDPAAALGWRETLAFLDEELQRLPGRYRLPLVLCYLEGATRDEAAQQLGWSLATVRRRVDRGRELLHARLLRRGVTLPAALAGVLATESAVLPSGLTAAALAAVRHWIAGPAEQSMIAASVLSLLREGAVAMGSTALRISLLLGAVTVVVGAGVGIYLGAWQSKAPPASPSGSVMVVDQETASLAKSVQEAQEALALCEPRGFGLLCELAVLQARRGDKLAARRLFDEAACAGSGPSRGVTMIQFAYYLADAGDVPAARAAMAEGRRLATAIKADNVRNDSLGLAAETTAELIDLDQGLADAEALPRDTRVGRLNQVVIWLAEKGDIAGALKALERMQTPYPYVKFGAWQALAAAQVRAGDTAAAQQAFRQALEASNYLREHKIGGWRLQEVELYCRFACAQHKAGGAAAARETLDRAVKSVDEAAKPDLGCLAELARAQAEMGQRDAARQSIKRFHAAAETYEEDQVFWARLIRALQALDDREGMIALLKREGVSGQQWVNDFWMDACKTLARSGRLEDARALARAALSPEAKAFALLGVSRGQLERVPPERRPRYNGDLTVTVPETAPPARPSPSPDPMKEYDQIIDAFGQAWGKFNKEWEKVRDPAERQRFYAEKAPSWSTAAAAMLQLAQRHPRERVALEALSWIAQYAHFTTEAETAYALLGQHHLAAKKLGGVCGWARFSRHSIAAEHFMRIVLEKSPHRSTRGQACLALAQFLQSQADLIRMLRQVLNPESIRSYEQSLGAARFRRLQGADPEPVLREAEMYYRRVLAEFADIYPPNHTASLATSARAALDEIHNLAIGQVAPDITGEDIDGKPLRLSEYRGKVVVLVFWAKWCGPCRQLIPAEKALVRRLHDRPFVLLGVNGDPDRAPLREWLAKEPLPWRSWWDGRPDNGNGSGPIALAWNVTSWPTVYVLDPKGVIRYRDLTGKDLDQAVETLLKETEKTPARP